MLPEAKNKTDIVDAKILLFQNELSLMILKNKSLHQDYSEMIKEYEKSREKIIMHKKEKIELERYESYTEQVKNKKRE